MAKRGLRELLEEEQALIRATEIENNHISNFERDIKEKNDKIAALMSQPIPPADLASFKKYVTQRAKDTMHALKTNEKIKENVFEDFQQTNCIVPVKNIYNSLATFVQLYKQLNAQKNQIIEGFTAGNKENSNANPNMGKLYQRNLDKLLQLSSRLNKYAALEELANKKWEETVGVHTDLEKSINAKLDVIHWKSNTIHNVLKNHLEINFEAFEECKHYIEELGTLDQKESCRSLHDILENENNYVLDDIMKNERLHLENSCIAEELKKEALRVEEHLEKLNQTDQQLTIKGELIRLS